MALSKTITLNSQHGTVEATATSASGSAVITFSFVWDSLNNRALSYGNGKITIDDEVVATFAQPANRALSVTTSNYSSLSDYGSMITEVINEFEASMQ